MWRLAKIADQGAVFHGQDCHCGSDIGSGTRSAGCEAGTMRGRSDLSRPALYVEWLRDCPPGPMGLLITGTILLIALFKHDQHLQHIQSAHADLQQRLVRTESQLFDANTTLHDPNKLSAQLATIISQQGSTPEPTNAAKPTNAANPATKGGGLDPSPIKSSDQKVRLSENETKETDETKKIDENDKNEEQFWALAHRLSDVVWPPARTSVLFSVPRGANLAEMAWSIIPKLREIASTSSEPAPVAFFMPVGAIFRPGHRLVMPDRLVTPDPSGSDDNHRLSSERASLGASLGKLTGQLVDCNFIVAVAESGRNGLGTGRRWSSNTFDPRRTNCHVHFKFEFAARQLRLEVCWSEGLLPNPLCTTVLAHSVRSLSEVATARLELAPNGWLLCTTPNSSSSNNFANTLVAPSASLCSVVVSF